MEKPTVLLTALALSMPASALALPFQTVQVASGLNQPLFATAAPGDAGRLFVVEKPGTIRVLDLTTGTVAADPFLDLSAQVSTNSEQGLLGLAFDPNYAVNGYFYVNLTNPVGDTEVRRYQVSATDPNQADAGSAFSILSIDQPQANHNGGWMGFGPNDGYLYIASGDGGGGNDDDAGHTPGIGNAQDTGNPLGAMLRIDVGGDDFAGDPDRNYAIPAGNPFVGQTGDDEIWAYGLRNPWRPSFDRATGDLYIADVGQNAREEVNFQPAASTGGENYGWRLREGTIATPGVGGARPPGNVDPVFDYSHTSGFGRSVTGGYVYRGPVVELQGEYFFGDFTTGRFWSFVTDGIGISDFTEWSDTLAPAAGSIDNIASFGEDAVGNLYILDFGGGEIYRIDPAAVPLPGSVALLGLGGLMLLRQVRRQRISSVA